MDDYYNKLLLNKLLVIKLQMMQEIELYENQITKIDSILDEYDPVVKEEILSKNNECTELICMSTLLAILGSFFYFLY